MRLFTEGFELGDLRGLTFTNSDITMHSPGRTGNYDIFSNSAAHGWYKSFTASSEVYAFVGFNVNGFNSIALGLYSGGTSIARIVSSYGTFISYFEETDLGQYATCLANIWYMLEIHLKIDDAPNGLIEFKSNGTIFSSYSGDTKVSASTVNRFFGNRMAGSFASPFWDDLALNDTTGSKDNSWVGDCHVDYLPANGNGDTNQWTGLDGDKVNNYQNVDDIPTDGDTTYNQSSTASEQDMYNVSDFSGTGKIIKRIWPEARAKDAHNSLGQIKLGYKTGGSVYLGSAQELSGDYVSVKGDAPTENPADSGDWEDADLDAIQFVVECE